MDAGVCLRVQHIRGISFGIRSQSLEYFISWSQQRVNFTTEIITRVIYNIVDAKIRRERERERLEEEENKRYNKETFRSREDSPKFDIQLSYSIGHERFSISRLFERKSGHTCRHNIESTVHLNITSYVNKRVWSPDEHVIFWHVYVHVIRKCNCRTIRMCKFGSDCEYIRDINIFTYFRCI